jgi:FkbM family methyltransferase
VLVLIEKLRRIALPVFQQVNPGDVTIGHPWTSDRIRVHSFKHKGYWFHGKKRERLTMQRFASLVRQGDCVLDLGGHIGYTALYFSYLAGPTGYVYVFEPSPENLPYLEVNVERCSRKNITIVRKAVGDAVGEVVLHYESVTGQNSTIMSDFPSFQVNCRSNNLNGEYKQCRVDLTTVDRFVDEHGLSPRFIKIDIEGAEFQALGGMTSTLENFRPRLMIETNVNGEAVWQLLSNAGYRLYSTSGEVIHDPIRLMNMTVNVFALHKGDCCV